MELTIAVKNGWKKYPKQGGIKLPEATLTERIEKHIRNIGAKKGANTNQIETILGLIKTIRTEGGISDESLLKIFELVGDE